MAWSPLACHVQRVMVRSFADVALPPALSLIADPFRYQGNLLCILHPIVRRALPRVLVEDRNRLDSACHPPRRRVSYDTAEPDRMACEARGRSCG